MDEELETIRVAAMLLKAVWSQIDPEYKSKYRMDIWTQVESNVAACARMNSTLTRFLSSLCGRFQVAVPGRTEEERQAVDLILRGGMGEPEHILQALREYPQVCVLQLRIMNDAEKEEKGYVYAANI